MKNLRQLMNIVDQFVEPKIIYEETVSVSFKINYLLYDVMYLLTSRRKNAKLLTMDNKLIKAANKIDIPVFNINSG